ncbi:hypothetical protein [Candidatus Palauibacter sp.]|uniref:hypothetical protein n=1 Tax=Candidatus Palauibacter sp. TaxID=3101350 RepID=UPI003CC69EF6
MVQVEIIEPMADGKGRQYLRGRTYGFQRDEAKRLVRAGIGRAVPADHDRAADLLHKLGGGLVVRKNTDRGLVKAAKRRRLVLRYTRPGRPPKADDGGDSS